MRTWAVMASLLVFSFSSVAQSNLPVMMLEVTHENMLLSRGTPQLAAWSSDSTQFIVGTHKALWRYDATALDAPPEKVYTFPKPLDKMVRLGFLDESNIVYVVDADFNQEGGNYGLSIIDLSRGRASTRMRLGNVDEVGGLVMSAQAGLFAVKRTKQVRLFRVEFANRLAISFKDRLELPFDVASVAFNADGTRLAVTGATRQHHEIHIFSLPDYTLESTLRAPSLSSVTHTAFSPDGTSLLLMGDYMAFRRLDLASGKYTQDYDTGQQLGVVALTNDGQTLAITQKFSKFATLYDTATGRSRIDISDLGTIEDIAVSPDGQRAAVVVHDIFNGAGSYVRVRDAYTGETLHLLPFQIDHAVLTNDTSQAVFRLAENLYFQPLEAIDRPLVPKLTLPAWVSQWTLSPDNTQLAISGKQYESRGQRTLLQVWDIATQTLVRENTQLAHTVDDLAYHPDGTTLAVVTNGAINLYDSQTLQEKRIVAYLAQGQPVKRVTFTADGQRMVAIGDSPVVRAWETQSYRTFLAFNAPASDTKLTFAALNTDGTIMMAGGASGLFFWNFGNGNLVKQLSARFAEGTWSEDGQQVYLLDYRQLIVYDPAQDRVLHALPITTMGIVAQGGALVLEYGEKLRLWQASAPDAVPAYVEQLRFSDDFERGRIRGWRGLFGFGKIEEEGGNRFVRFENNSDANISFEPVDNPAAGNMVLEVRLRIVRTANQSSRPNFDLMIEQPDKVVGIYNYLSTKSWAVSVFTPNAEGHGIGFIQFSPPPSTWFTVRIEALRDNDGTGTLNIYIDGHLVKSTTKLTATWGKFKFTSIPSTVIDMDDVRIYESVPYAIAMAPPTPIPTPTPDATLRFFSDFEAEDVNAWELADAANAVSFVRVDGNGVLWINGTQRDYISLRLKQAYRDVNTLEMRVMFLDDGRRDGVMNLNLFSDGTGHARGFSALVSRYGAFLAERQDNFNVLDAIQSQPFTLELGRWYTLRFHLRRQLLTLFVDDVAVVTSRVDPSTQQGVPVFIFDSGMSLYIDNVALYSR